MCRTDSRRCLPATRPCVYHTGASSSRRHPDTSFARGSTLSAKAFLSVFAPAHVFHSESLAPGAPRAPCVTTASHHAFAGPRAPPAWGRHSRQAAGAPSFKAQEPFSSPPRTLPRSRPPPASGRPRLGAASQRLGCSLPVTPRWPPGPRRWPEEQEAAAPGRTSRPRRKTWKLKKPRRAPPSVPR